jgi:hypothetical protein
MAAGKNTLKSAANSPLSRNIRGPETFLVRAAAVELVDGGVWANNPIGVAAIEAIGMLGWPGDRLKILSIGTINESGRLPRLRGKLPMAATVARLFMAGQAHSALGTAKIVTGDVHRRKAIWRIDQTAPEGRYTLDNAGRISEMRPRICRGTRTASRAQAAFLQRTGGGIRAIPRPLKGGDRWV